MRSAVLPFVALAGVLTGVAGVLELDPALSEHAALLLSMGLLAAALLGLRLSYRSTPVQPAPTAPRPLLLPQWAAMKVLLAWLDAFKVSYIVQPGLYFTGDRYDRDAPLLVTANPLMTVWLLRRALGGRSVRILVLDTGGINVWCAASEGRFSNQTLLDALGRYDRELLTGSRWLRLILPKLAMAGIDLRALREHKLQPVIGPVRAADLPAFLDAPKPRDQSDDHVVFGLRARAFTWLPGLVQVLSYGAALVLAFVVLHLWLGSSIPFGLLGLAALISTTYPLLFPWLPGERFATKGLWLGGALSLGVGLAALGGWLRPSTLPAALALTMAASLFMGLGYPGNSAVSNYTRIRAEIARFMPLDLGLFALAALLWAAAEVWA